MNKDWKTIKYILFTHDDLDGVGCRVIWELAHSEYKDNCTVIHCTNDDIDQKVQQAIDEKFLNSRSDVWFTDICPTKKTLDKVLNMLLFSDHIQLYDHHRTNLWVNDYKHDGLLVELETDDGKMESGTSLLYKHFKQYAEEHPDDFRSKYFGELIPNHLDSFAETVREYDTYEWKGNGSMVPKKFQTLFMLLGLERFSSKFVQGFINNSVDTLIGPMEMDFVDSRLEFEQRMIHNAIQDTEKTYIRSIKGFRCALRFAGGASISELGHQYLTQNPNIDVFIGIFIGDDGLAFRTVKHYIDTGSIFAKPFGGGGHSKASGCKLPNGKKIKESIINQIVNSLIGGS